MTTDSPVLTLKQAAERLQLSKRTLTGYLLAGEIPAIRTKGTTGEWRIRERDLDEWFDRRSRQFQSEIQSLHPVTTSGR